jgi:hypothetical protein
MPIFNEILNALNNPTQQANTGQLQQILNTVQQLSSTARTNPSTMETMLSVVGSYVRSSLRQTCSTSGEDQAQNLVNQFSGTQPNQRAVEAVLSAGMQQQVVQDLIKRTGLDAQTIRGLLPVLVPLALNLLQSGTNTQTTNSGRANSVLKAFLDSNQDGDVDLGDALKVASRFLNRQ